MKLALVSTVVAALTLSACAQETAKTPTPDGTTPPTQSSETSGNSATDEVSVASAREMTSSGSVTLIDVRKPDEWRKTGLAASAQGITLQDSDFLDQVLAATGGDKTRPVALICRSGNRSKKAAARLKAAGHATVYNVTGGTLAWKKEGLPIEACRSC